MSTYRYNVVVDVTIDTKGTKGAASNVSGVFQGIEQEAKASTSRIQKVWDDTLNFQVAKVRSASKEAGSVQQQVWDQQQKVFDKAVGDFNRSTQQQAQQQAKIRQYAQQEMQQGLDNIKRITKSQDFDDAQRKIKQITTNTEEGAEKFGVWGRAFRGAFIGAVAGIAFSTIIGGIGSIISKTEEAIVASVNYAAVTEQVTNSLTFFTGSAAQARSEIAAIDQAARSTPGLRLLDAEQGIARLRALGFEAQTARNLVVGIAKERLISGTTDENAVNRVIINLQQLRAGSPQIQRDIQQMILALPSLNIEITKTFGSIQKFREELGRDPRSALDKFAQGLANAEAPAGGLLIMVEKLEDAVISAGRSFGEPLLEPLEQGIKLVTAAIYDNQSAFAAWGTDVGNIIRANVTALSEFLKLTNGDQSGGTQSFYRTPGFATAAAAGPLGWLAYGGYKLQTSLGASQQSQEQLERSRTAGPAGTPFDLDPTTNTIRYKSPEQVQKERDKDALNQRITDEKTKQAHLSNISQTQQIEYQMTQSFYAKQEALLKSHLDFTTRDQLKTAQAVAANKQAQYTAERALIIKQFQELEKSGNLDQDAYIKAYQDAAGKLNKLDSDRVISAAQSRKEIAEIQQREIEDRRQAAIELTNIEQQAAEQRQSAIETSIQRQIDTFETGYGDLIAAASAGTIELSRIIAERTALQLQDQKLTAEQRVNIEKQAYLEISNLAQRNAEKIQQIQDAAFEATKRRLQEAAQVASSLNQTFSGGLRKVFEQLAPGAFAGQNLGLGATNSAGQATSYSQIFGFGTSVSIGGVQSGNVSTIQARAQLLEKIHQNEAEDIEAQIRLTNDLMDIERQRALAVLNNNIAIHQTNAQLILDKLKEAQAGGNEAAIKSYQEQYDLLQATLRGEYTQQSRLNEGKPASAEGYRLASQKRQLESQSQIAGINREIEKSEFEQANLLSEISKRTDEITKGAYDRQIAEAQSLEANKNYQATILADREQQIALGSKENVMLLRNTELIRDQMELRNEELEALFAIDKANLKISQQYVYSANKADARVAEFLASQKGITEIMSDLKINLITEAYNGMDAAIGRLTSKMGVFGGVVKDLISNLIKLALNPLFSKLFGGGGSSTGGGFSLGGFGGFGGGGGASGGGLNLGSIFGGNAGGGIFNFGGGNLGIGPANAASGPYGGLLGAINQLPSGGVTTSDIGLLGAGAAKSAGGGLSSLFNLSNLGSAFATAGISLGIQTLIMSTQTHSPGVGFLEGGLFGMIFGFLNRNRRRRREEGIRNQAMLDAFASIDKLIDSVKADKMDGEAALEQADGIRKKYLDDMSQLKDKKTRNIALKDVSRIDSKIMELKSAVSQQASRRERLELMVPTFAAGGLRMNPVGYQGMAGPQMAIFNERGPEYILDAETTRNVGVGNLDMMRATRGRSIRNSMPVISRAVGGVTTPSLSASSASSSGMSSNPMTLELSLNVGISQESFVEIANATIKGNDGSREQITAIVKNMSNSGNDALAQQLKKILGIT